MKIGTRSLLFGAHQFLIHPFFVSLAWIKLYGFPFDPRIWLSFIVHDWGYWGKSNMDGLEGKTHPMKGAVIMSIFGEKWFLFSLLHSRFYSKLLSMEPSRLCYADKLGTWLEPRYLYLLRVSFTKEMKEYMGEKYSSSFRKQKKWMDNIAEKELKWIYEKAKTV